MARGDEKFIARAREAARQGNQTPEVMVVRIVERQIAQALLPFERLALRLDALGKVAIKEPTKAVPGDVVDATYGAQEAAVINGLRESVKETQAILTELIAALRESAVTRG